MDRMTAEIRELNESQLPRYVRVTKGTTLNCPRTKVRRAGRRFLSSRRESVGSRQGFAVV